MVPNSRGGPEGTVFKCQKLFSQRAESTPVCSRLSRLPELPAGGKRRTKASGDKVVSMTPRRRRSDSAASPSRESRRPKHLGRKAESRQRAGHDESSRSATIEDGSEGFDDSTDREISPDSWSSDETNNVPLGAWPRGGEEGLTDWEQPETLYNEVGTIATEILHRRRIVATAATSALAKSPQPSRSALPLIAPALPKSLQRGLVLGVAQRLESLLASLAQEQEAARERHDEEKLIDASDVLEAVQRLRSGNVMSETLLARLSKIVEEFDVPAAAVDKAPSGTSDSSSSSQSTESKQPSRMERRQNKQSELDKQLLLS